MKSNLKLRKLGCNNEYKKNTVIYNQKSKGTNELSLNISNWYYNYPTTGNSMYKQCSQNLIRHAL